MIGEPRTAKTLVLLSLALALAGCAVRPDHYYVLTSSRLLDTDREDKEPLLPFTLAIQSLDAARPFADERMAYRKKGDVELGYYHSHRWAAAPPDLVQDALKAGLRDSNIFAAVWDYSDPQPADYVLGGTVRWFEELDYEDHWEAHLSLDVFVTQDEKIVYSRMFELSEPAQQRSPAAVARAMSGLIERMLDVLVEEFAVKLEPPRPGR